MDVFNFCLIPLIYICNLKITDSLRMSTLDRENLIHLD
jgi:hypothetical protein